MTTDYTTLKKELTKAIKEAGYNTKQIKILKGSGVGSYYSETSFSLCSYGEDVELEINEKGITVDKVNEITRETLQTYKAHATIKASDALRAQFEDLAQEVEEKIKNIKINGIVYNDKNVELWALKYDGEVRLKTKAANIKSDWVKNYTAKSMNQYIIDILVGIEIGDPAVCDFSEAYLLDGDTEEEVNLNFEMLRTKQDIKKIEEEIKEAEQLRDEIKTGLKEAKAAEATIVNTIATYSAYNWGYADIIYSTQRNEFSKIKYYTLNSIGKIKQLKCTLEDIKAQSYIKDSATTAGKNIANALSYIREQITYKEEELQDRNDEIESLQSYLTESSKKLNKLEEDFQKLLNK